MGYYINPPDETKEQFLRREGTLLGGAHLSWDSVPEGYLPVILVDNGLFTAAGIAYSADELKVFTQTTDPRPREIYLVRLEKILEVCEDLRDVVAAQ